MPTSDALLAGACEELVSRCGFHRAVMSRVEANGWRPLVLHQRSEDDMGSWFSAWINQFVPTDRSSPEADTLSRRRPSLVYDTANTEVYRPLIVQSGHSRSYLVAPLVHGDDVVGFLHIDHHPLPRRVDEADREVLWAFADGFSHIYERTVLVEQLRAQRDSMRDLFLGAVDRIDDLCESSEAARAGDGRDGREPKGPGVTPSAELTDREAQVFDLMVTGATNQAIAERLVITEGTVKSHVKHILRKYGAVNRAQAIAWALRDGDSAVRSIQ
jgi:DNA-binding CsgD family transcriptional regulator